MGAAPLIPASAFFQKSVTVKPIGVAAPIPVTTTRRAFPLNDIPFSSVSFRSVVRKRNADLCRHYVFCSPSNAHFSVTQLLPINTLPRLLPLQSFRHLHPGFED